MDLKKVQFLNNADIPIPLEQIDAQSSEEADLSAQDFIDIMIK